MLCAAGGPNLALTIACVAGANRWSPSLWAKRSGSLVIADATDAQNASGDNKTADDMPAPLCRSGRDSLTWASLRRSGEHAGGAGQLGSVSTRSVVSSLKAS